MNYSPLNTGCLAVNVMKDTKFKPGNPGKPKGAKNKVVFNIRSKVADFITDNWEAVQIEFSKLEPKDKLHFLEKLMSYSIPKLSSVAYTDETEKMIDRLTDEELNNLVEELKNS